MRFGSERIPAPAEFTLLPAAPDPQKCVALPIDPNYEEVKRQLARSRTLRAEFEARRAEQLGLMPGGAYQKKCSGIGSRQRVMQQALQLPMAYPRWKNSRCFFLSFVYTLPF